MPEINCDRTRKPVRGFLANVVAARGGSRLRRARIHVRAIILFVHLINARSPASFFLQADACYSLSSRARARAFYATSAAIPFTLSRVVLP